MEAPKRAYELTIKISGDTWENVIQQLDYLCPHIDTHGPACSSVMGGYDCSHSVTILHNPEMSHEKFTAELEKYVSSIKESDG